MKKSTLLMLLTLNLSKLNAVEISFTGSNTENSPLPVTATVVTPEEALRSLQGTFNVTNYRLPIG